MEEETNPIKKCKNNSYILADFFVREHVNIVRSLNSKDTVELYNFTGEIYEYISDDSFDFFMSQFFSKHKITDRWKNSVLSEMKRAIFVSSRLKKVDFNNYNNLICLNNGVYDLDTGTLQQHNSKYYFTSMINIDYDPTQEETPNFDTFLQQIFKRKDNTTDEQTANLITQIGGYLLFPKNIARVMFIFLGDGANGKSLLIDLFSMFFDPQNITNTELEILTDPKSLEREGVVQSRVNLTTETSSKKGGINPQQLKKIISGESIDVLRKYKKPIKGFKPNTKIIMAANADPYLNDTSYGMGRRFITVSFPCRFVTKQNYEQVKNPTNKKIYLSKDSETLLDSFKKELPAILNLFLKHLKILKDNNFVFPDTDNTIQTKIEYTESTDTIGTYLRDNYMEDVIQNNIVFVQDILATYRVWHKNNVSEKPLVLSANHISRRIKSIFNLDSFTHCFYQGTTRARKKAFYLKHKIYEDEELIDNIQGNEGGGETPPPELPRGQGQQTLPQNQGVHGQNNNNQQTPQAGESAKGPETEPGTQILKFGH